MKSVFSFTSSIILLLVQAEDAPSVPYTMLTPEGKMPSIGFGTWQARGKDLAVALEAALDTGYRHIDTAYVYENEHIIGRVLKYWFDTGKLKREDVFIVSKLPEIGNTPEQVEKYLNRTLQSLHMNYVDLYLIHDPFGVRHTSDGKLELDPHTDIVAVWKAMEKQVDAGKTKAIGLSNFNSSQISRILKAARIKPSNLQVEVHAYMQQKPLLEYAKKHNISVTGFSPLGSPGLKDFFKNIGLNVTVPNILQDPVVEKIAHKRNKTSAQVLLRHGLQNGITVLPKSVHAERVKENFDVFNFELDENDMKELNGLDRGDKGRLLDISLIFSGAKEHPEYPF